MNELHAAYPIQTRKAFFSRVAKYSLFRIVGWPWVYGFIVRAYRLCGGDYDRALGNAAHSFPGAEFFQQIRRRPSVALVRLLQRRLATFDAIGLARLRRRTSRGNQLAASLPPGMVIGGQNDTHTYWVMPLRVANAGEVLPALQRAGFDATARSSLIVVRLPDGAASDPPCATAPWLRETIFLPNCHDIPDSEWTRVAIILGNVASAVAEPAPASEPSDTIRVSVPS
jgi:dTDP-4-amino-4,6-dideoxygalactose transaminase